MSEGSNGLRYPLIPQMALFGPFRAIIQKFGSSVWRRKGGRGNPSEKLSVNDNGKVDPETEFYGKDSTVPL